MEKKLFLLLVTIITLINTSISQDITASTAKIGILDLRMNISDVEKIIKKSIPKSELIKFDTSYNYHTKIKIDSINYEVRFNKEYDSLGNALPSYKMFSIKCNSNKVKTKSGLVIGMTKFKAMELLDKAKILFGYSKEKDYGIDEGKSEKIIEKFTFYDNKTSDMLIIYLKEGIIESFELTEAIDGC
jgi:hypothetical protein